MKYGYKEAQLSLLIGNYEISENIIIIHFLDGSTSKVPYTKERESEILNTMLTQAMDKMNSSAYADAQREKRKSLCWLTINAVLTLSNMYFAVKEQELLWQLNTLVLGTGTMGKYLDYKIQSFKIEELKKYKIFLEIQEKLGKYNINALLEGIDIDSIGDLNINTIDNYSLKDMQKVRDNLNRYEQFSQIFKEEKAPQFIKS